MVSVSIKEQRKRSHEGTVLTLNLRLKKQFNIAYIEVVTVHSAAYTSLLLWWELLLGELEH